jgi:16S rRNA (guanine(527)-N(7))-methyltransferase RsmG
VSYLEILESELSRFEIELDSVQKEKLAIYCEELSRWNQKINLTSLEGGALVRRLVLEPAWVGNQLKLHGILLDIGSGNGSPAIPLEIVCGFRKCHLVEPRTKRAVFLRHLIATLNLVNTEVHKARFENLERNIESPDWITLQAVAFTKDMWASIRMISTSTTNVVWITSSTVQTELQPSHIFSIPVTNSKVLVFGPAAQSPR